MIVKELSDIIIYSRPYEVALLKNLMTYFPSFPPPPKFLLEAYKNSLYSTDLSSSFCRLKVYLSNKDFDY